MMLSALNPALLTTNPGASFALPMYAVETRWKFNDATFNCMGRFRSDALSPDAGCGSNGRPDQPQWGCADDSNCPPGPDFGDPGTTNAGPGYTTGFFLIVDLERAFDIALGQTFCVTYLGRPAQALVAEGWIVETPDGLACRGAPKWNPDLPDDAGLPPGDWCSRTNAPATATCHDAYRSISYSASQAFKVLDGTCQVQ
jgi:hypothetical protein